MYPVGKPLLADQPQSKRPKQKPGPAPRKERMAQKIRMQERRKKAAELLAAGMTMEVVAKTCHYYDASHARRDLKKFLLSIATPDTEMYRAVMLQQVALLQQRVSQQIFARPSANQPPPDPKLEILRIRELNRLMSQVRHLVPGLEAPLQVQHAGLDLSTLTEQELIAIRDGLPLPQPNGHVRGSNGVAGPASPGEGGSGAGTPPEEAPKH